MESISTTSRVLSDTPGMKRVRVFIVEDHGALRQLLVSYLGSSTRYEVVGQSNDGVNVVEECARLKPQVLILDLELPACDGLDLIGLVCSRSPGTQILVFSALSDVATVRRAIEAGACGFIEKAATIEALDEAITSVALGQPFYGDGILRTIPALILGETESYRSELSPREREVLTFVANGRSSREIAADLKLSVRTIENHRGNIMRTLGARNIADLTREAIHLGLVSVNRPK